MLYKVVPDSVCELRTCTNEGSTISEVPKMAFPGMKIWNTVVQERLESHVMCQLKPGSIIHAPKEVFCSRRCGNSHEITFCILTILSLMK